MIIKLQEKDVQKNVSRQYLKNAAIVKHAINQTT